MLKLVFTSSPSCQEKELPTGGYQISFGVGVCVGTSVVLKGNIPKYGSGRWSLKSGSGNIESPTNYETVVTNLDVGENSFIWTITDVCGNISSDEINVHYIKTLPF